MRLFRKPGGDGGLPPDKLEPRHLAVGKATLQAVSGVPATADGCAYDPIQRLLAVSTSDGRVKILGAAGVERTLTSAATTTLPAAATRQLVFLHNRGGVARVCAAGRVELWSVDAAVEHGGEGGGPLDALELEGGVGAGGDGDGDDDDGGGNHGGGGVTRVAPMQHEPYLLLGTACGALRVAALVNASGSAVSEARQVRGLKLMPHIVPPSRLDASGAVTSLAVLSRASNSTTNSQRHLALCVHRGSGSAAVWDLRAQELVAVVGGQNSKSAKAAPAARRAGAATAAAWLAGSARGDYATGHAAGAVLLWALPGPAELRPRLLARLRAGDAPARPVRCLDYVGGARGGERLLVFGGQHEDRPDGLIMLPLPERSTSAGDGVVDAGGDGAAQGARKLPWFAPVAGHALVPAEGALTGAEDPVAVLVLGEGGELMAHALGGGGVEGAAGGGVEAAPRRLVLPFQAAPAVTAARLRVMPSERVPLQGLQGASLAGLRAWSKTAASRTLDAAADAAWRGILSGGVAPAHDPGRPFGTVLATGHADGRVRLWDVAGEAPRLLGSVPSREAEAALAAANKSSNAGAPPSSPTQHAPTLPPVSALDLAWEQGLLIVGADNGSVCVYQFGEASRRVELVTFDSVGGASNNASAPLQEPPGFQLRLVSRLLSAGVTAVAYSPATKMVAAGDAAGSVALVDLSRPAVLWLQAPLQRPIAALSLCDVPLPAPRERSELAPHAGRAAGAAVRAVLAVGSDASLAALDADTGFVLARDGALKPKNAATALAVEVLDAGGSPTWMARDVGALVELAAAGGGKGGKASPSQQQQQRSPQHIAGRPLGEGHEGDDEDGSGGGRSDSDVDVDELLARAAAQVDERRPRHGRGGGALTKAAAAPAAPKAAAAAASNPARSRGRSGSPSPSRAPVAAAAPASPASPSGGHSPVVSQRTRLAAAAAPPPPGSDDGEAASSSPAATTSAALAALALSSGGKHAAVTPAAESGDDDGPAAATAAATAAAAAKLRGGNGAPIALHEPAAAYVVVATTAFLRLYSAAHVAAADRTTAKRVALPGTLLFAAAFAAGGRGGAPALACVVRPPDAASADAAELAVYSLPGLERVAAAPLSELTGWRWRWDSRAAASEARLAHVCACTRRGHVALLAPGQELVRLGLSAGLAPLQPPASTYDWDLASAAHMAAVAYERAAAAAEAAAAEKAAQAAAHAAAQQHQHAAAGSHAAGDRSDSDGGDGSGGGGGDGGRPRDLRGLFTKIGADLNRAGGTVARGLQAAAVETQRGLQKVAQAVGEDLPSLLLSGALPGSGGAPAQPAEPALPSLEAVFSGRTNGTDGGGVSLGGAAASAAALKAAAAAAAAPAQLGKAAASVSSPDAQHGGIAALHSGGAAGSGADAAARAELFSAGGRPVAAASAAAPTSPTRPSTNISSSTGRVRTAAEIRAAYGRPLNAGSGGGAVATTNTASGVAGARGVMEDNVAKLAERGERLRAMQDKSAAMSDDAAGFAELAKQLADRERGRAKWFG